MLLLQYEEDIPNYDHGSVVIISNDGKSYILALWWDSNGCISL